MAGIRRHLSFLILFTLWLYSSVFAGDLPPVAPETYSLTNGLRVILHEDHSVPVVAVNLWYHVGSKEEEPGLTGFAHLFEHMMFQGSEHQPGEHFELLEQIGADANGSTSKDRTNYYESVPSNYLELALWLEADRMGFLLPALTEEKLSNQKEVVLNERRQSYENQPYGRVWEMLPGALYPVGHPYSWPVIGFAEDIRNASKEDVEAFFRKYYTPNNASLVIAGDLDPEKTRRLVEKYFGDIPSGPPITRLKRWPVAFDSQKRIILEDRVGLPRLYMVWHTPPFFSPGDAELDILASILSSGKNSRLYNELVYERQIAQDVSAFQSSQMLGSTFMIIATARPGHSLVEIEAAVDEQLRKLAAEPPSPEEVTRAKNSFEAGFVRSMQQINGMADRLNMYYTYVGRPDYFQPDLDRYLKITPADVAGSVKESLPLDRRLVVSVLAQTEAAEKAEVALDRSRTPTGGPTPQFNLPEPDKAVLSNGLPVMIVRHSELPLVQLTLLVPGGGSADPSAKPGTATLTAELLDEGTGSRDALRLSDELKGIGAGLSSRSTRDASFLALNTLKVHLDKALELYADVLINPTFPEEELERQRKQYLARLLQEARQPGTIAFKVFLKTLFGGDHPYGRWPTGTEASLNAINRADLENFYRERYRPDNCTLIVVGDVSPDEIVPKLNQALGGWKKGRAKAVKIPRVGRPEGRRIYLIDRPGAPQSTIVCGGIGIPRSSERYIPAAVMNQVLGGKFTSRLNMVLREEKGYTYGAFSRFSSLKDAGSFYVNTSVHTEFTKESVAEIMGQLEGVRGSRPLTDNELRAARDNLVLGYPAGFETSGQIASHLAEAVVYGLPVDHLEKFVPEVEAVSRPEVNDAAVKLIDPNSLVLIIVGDREKIEPGLITLDLGPIVHLDHQGDRIAP